MYSKVSKYSPEARKRMAYRSSKGKSCGYYMKIVFFFSSLIQSLIIVSLVLFLVYGKQEDTASVARVQDLELRFSQLSLETVDLRQQRKNLTNLLNRTSMEMARNEWDLAQLRFHANISYVLLDDMEKKLKQCNFGRINCPPQIPRTPFNPVHAPFGVGCNCNMQMETLKAKMELVHANFTQTAMQMQMEMDQITRERDNINLEAIQLRRDKSVHEKAIEFYQIKCKDEFVNSLSGISNVSKAFLTKIDSLFHALSPFHLTCPKQKDYLDQIRNNCSDLSEEVVTKFQAYLDTLGSRVSMYQGNISVLTAENMRMTRDYNQCSQNRTGLIREHKKHVERIQLRHDEEKKTLLNEKKRLHGNIDVLESSIKLRNSQLEHMNEQLKHLNLSCIPRTGGLYPRPGNQPYSNLGPQSGSSNQGFPSSNSGLSQFNHNSNFGSSSSSSSSGSSFGSLGFNKPSSTGLGSSSLGSNSGSFFNKPGSSNQGSSSSAFGSSATGLNKPTSTGLGSSSSYGSSLGSSGSGLNKPTSTGLGSSSSLGSSLGSSGTGLNKPTSTGLGSSSSYGSSLGSSGTGLNKPTSTGLGSSSSLGSSLGSSGTGLNKPTSTGLGSSSSLGSSLGSSNNPSSSSSSLNRFGSGTSSSSSLGSRFGSSSSSLGSNFGSSNSGLGSSSSSSTSKTTSNSRGSSNSFFGSSSSSSSSSLGSSSSSQNKLSSSSSNKDSSSSSSSGSSSTASKNPFGGWFGLGGGSSSSSSSNSNSDQSKLGSNQGRGPSTSGTSFGSFGSGRTNTFSYTGPISVNQHLRDLQRIINPPGPEEKQELSRIMG